jgi:hypothetical protein
VTTVPQISLFQVRHKRAYWFAVGQAHYNEQQSIDSHGLKAGDPYLADFKAGWSQAETRLMAELARFETQRMAVALARGH